MRKLFLLISVMFLSYCVMAQYQQKQTINLSSTNNRLDINNIRAESFAAKLSLKEIKLGKEIREEGIFSVPEILEGTKPSNVGQANLPIISKMIEIPYDANVQVEIISYRPDTINISDYGLDKIIPTQPSYPKNTPEDEMYFVIDEDYYSNDLYETTPLVKTEILGIMRGMRIGRIEIRPYHYNPVKNTLIVYNDLEFKIKFIGSDLSKTEEMKKKYYAEEFSPIYSNAINYIPSQTKDGFYDTSNPMKYVIVANTQFESTLEPFVQWKTKQGYNVIEHYVASGTPNTTIKSYLEGLYTGATASDPAPLYVLIIGDHSGNYSIPAFNSQISGKNHVTDVYFGEYDGGGDYIPDVYLGRLSCNTTTELQNALDKILPYEQYTMPSTSHLNNAVLIAGADSYWGPRAGDAAIWYFAEYYINESHGFDNIYAYYQNQPSGPYFAGDSDASDADDNIIANINSGIGFANYTAHCNEDGWADPSVTNSDIQNFNNQNKYPFMIGNCCLSFKFNSDDSFGENLLQTANEGAVGYIGTSNNSLWDEDFWWGVGLTSLDHENTSNVGSFSPANSDDGVYDALMHENGQAFEDWYYTASQMIYAGNTAVNSSSSGNKKYYWEIYHCSGDPSIMPYMTEPTALSLSFSDPMIGNGSLTVTTEPYTYVALSKDNVLLDAKWSGAGTSVTLTPPTNFTGATYCVVGTKQDRSPYINENVVPLAANPPVADFNGTPTTILDGQSVSFTDASQNAAEWSWNFGDGETSTEQNPTHIYTTVGTYTVSLTVTNPLGNDTETKTDYITVNLNTNPPVADFEADQTNINPGGTVNFTDLSTNNPNQWTWTFEGANITTSNEQNPSVTYSNPGTYQVSLQATNDYGTDEEIKTGYITVNQITYCSGSAANEDEYISNVTFAGINNDSDWASYTDYRETHIGNVVQGNSYPISVTDGKTYQYDEVYVWIDFNIDGDFDDAGEKVFEGPAAGSNTEAPHTWNGTVNIPTDAVVGTTTMRVRLNYNSNWFNTSVTTPCGESSYGEVEDYGIVISPAETVPVADFSASATSGCDNLTVNFTDLTTGSPSTWAWNFGDGNTSTEQNPTHTYSNPGTYTVELTASNTMGNDVATYTDLITITATPLVDNPADVTECETYTLPALTNGDYYATTGGVSLIAVGTQITSTQTIYVYAENGSCNAENSFVVTIDEMPTIDNPVDVSECGSYTLPALTNGDYYATTGGVSPIAVGTEITSTQTIYVYAENGSCSAENSFVVTINPEVSVSATTINETGAGNNDGSITVTISGGTPDFQGTWSGGLSNTTTSGTTMTQTGLAGGNYTVTISDANGCTATTNAIVNTDGSAPIADFEADITSGCDNLTVTFNDLSNNSPASWSWTFGDGNSSTEQNPVHTYNTPGTYTVSLTVTNNTGSDDVTMTDYITVGETPSLTMSMTQETATGNDGTANVTIDGGSTPYTIIWSNGDNTETISNLVANTYCVTVTEGAGCNVSDCIDVTQELNEPVAEFSANETEGCGTLTVNFTDLSTNSPTTYMWSFGDGTNSSEQNPVHTYDTPGLYTVELYVENNDGNNTNTKNDYIIVYENPNIDVVVTPASGSNVADGAASANVTNGTEPYTIVWSDGQEGDAVTNLIPGDYSVSVEDANGCTASADFVVNWVSFNEVETTVLNIYPNPTKNIVNIELDKEICNNIQILDVVGKVIFEVKPESNITKIDVSNLKSGVYFIKAILDNKELTHKMVVN